MLTRLLLVALGGAVGALARYGVAEACKNRFGDGLPVGTIVVNLIGCFAIGCLGSLIIEETRPEARALVIVGFLGSLTTFSTFAWEARDLFANGEPIKAILYVAASNALGILGVTLGFLITR